MDLNHQSDQDPASSPTFDAVIKETMCPKYHAYLEVREGGEELQRKKESREGKSQQVWGATYRYRYWASTRIDPKSQGICLRPYVDLRLVEETRTQR